MAIRGKGKPAQFIDYYGKRWAVVSGPSTNHYINLNREETLRRELDNKIKEINAQNDTINSLNKNVTDLQGKNSQLETDKTSLENKLNAIPVDWKQQINDANKQITDAYKLLGVKSNEDIKTLLAGKTFQKIINDADALPVAQQERDDLKANIKGVEAQSQPLQGEMELDELEKRFAKLNQTIFVNAGLPVTYQVLRETIEAMIALDKANRERLGLP